MKSLVKLALKSQRIRVATFFVIFLVRTYLQNRILLVLSQIKSIALLRVKLVKGWRTVIDTDLGLRFSESNDVFMSGYPPRFTNSLINAPSTLKMLVKSRTPVSYPFEVVTKFVNSEKDGNFNSLTKSTAEIDLQNFRNNPAFHFLTPGTRIALRQTEHFKRLVQMGIPCREIEQDLKTLASLSAVDPEFHDGLVWHMDVIHYFFLRQIALIKNSKDKIRVLEIGGGYGGLARQAFLLKHVSIDEYTIIDIPLTLGLIEKYLISELSPESFAKVRLIDATQDNFHTQLPEQFDLGIATHSLSEQDPTIVNMYLAKVIPRCESFLLSMQRRFHINNLDYDWLFRRFLNVYKLRQLVITEGLNVLNSTFENKPSKTKRA